MTGIMEFVAGIVLMALARGRLFYFLPRGGKTGRFVGTEWEAYCVVAMIGIFWHPRDPLGCCSNPRDLIRA